MLENISQDLLNQSLPLTETPFLNIGLAFSGGGYRAACFSLGILSYLRELHFTKGDPLLKHVSFISSASGGTIANTTYALHSANGSSFDSFYKELFEKMEGIYLLDKVFAILNNDDLWKHTHKKRNMINAFALAYDDLLLGKQRLGALKKNPLSNHLDEVCFNTTDFYRGLLFKQSVKMKPDIDEPGFLYGNFMMHLSHKEAERIKLSDALAASSCFPAGFEPINFPGDFINQENTSRDILKNLCIESQELDWNELDRVYEKKEVEKLLATLPKPIDISLLALRLKALPIKDCFATGFMDGGITDNQGLESLMSANNRRVSKKTSFQPFDLMLVNDVGSHYMDPYKPAKEEREYTGLSGLSLNTIAIIASVLGIIGLSLLIYGLSLFSLSLVQKVVFLFGVILLIVGGGILIVFYVLRKFIQSKMADGSGLNLDKNFSPVIVQMLFRHFGRTPIGVIVTLLKDRFNSVLILNNDVFLKRIRQILYRQFINEGKNSFRLKTNHVYDLAFANDLNRSKNDFSDIAPGSNLKIIAQAAFEMATTLWFDAANQKDFRQAALVACGQFTTCYNLLLYIKRMKIPVHGEQSYFDKLSAQYQQIVSFIEKQLIQHYHQFQQDPFWMYNLLGQQYHISNFQPRSVTEFPFPAAFDQLRN